MTVTPYTAPDGPYTKAAPDQDSITSAAKAKAEELRDFYEERYRTSGVVRLEDKNLVDGRWHVTAVITHAWTPGATVLGVYQDRTVEERHTNAADEDTAEQYAMGQVGADYCIKETCVLRVLIENPDGSRYTFREVRQTIHAPEQITAWVIVYTSGGPDWNRAEDAPAAPQEAQA